MPWDQDAFEAKLAKLDHLWHEETLSYLGQLGRSSVQQQRDTRRRIADNCRALFFLCDEL